jgi:hypothetical protein
LYFMDSQSEMRVHLTDDVAAELHQPAGIASGVKQIQSQAGDVAAAHLAKLSSRSSGSSGCLSGRVGCTKLSKPTLLQNSSTARGRSVLVRQPQFCLRDRCDWRAQSQDLPLLADMLTDAGCTDADILEHCRSHGEHVLGCWVVDVLLGKE